MSHLRSKTCHTIARIRRGRATVAARVRPRWSARGVRQPGTWPGKRERGIGEHAAGQSSPVPAPVAAVRSSLARSGVGADLCLCLYLRRPGRSCPPCAPMAARAELPRSALTPAGQSLPAPTADVAELLGTHALDCRAELVCARARGGRPELPRAPYRGGAGEVLGAERPLPRRTPPWLAGARAGAPPPRPEPSRGLSLIHI